MNNIVHRNENADWIGTPRPAYVEKSCVSWPAKRTLRRASFREFARRLVSLQREKKSHTISASQGFSDIVFSRDVFRLQIESRDEYTRWRGGHWDSAISNYATPLRYFFFLFVV